MAKRKKRSGIIVLLPTDTAVRVRADGGVVIHGPQKGRSLYHALFQWIFEDGEGGAERRKDLMEAMMFDLQARQNEATNFALRPLDPIKDLAANQRDLTPEERSAIGDLSELYV